MKNVKKYRLLCLATAISCSLNLACFGQYNNHHKYYIDLGCVGGIQLPQVKSLGVFGGFGFNFIAFNKPSSLDIRFKELYVTKPTDQQATLITLTYRMPIIKGLFIGIGGAHGHQIMAKQFLDEPVTAIMGSNEHIMHATGFNTELGYSFSSLIKNKKIGIYPQVTASYTQLSGHREIFKHLCINTGFKIGFKKID